MKERKSRGKKPESPKRRFISEENKFESPGKRFEPSGKKFGAPKKRFEPREKKFGSEENKFESQGKRFGSNDKKFGSSEKKFEPREQKFDSPKKRFGSGENKFESPKKRFESKEKKFESPESRFSLGENKFETPRKRFEPGEKKFESPQKRFESRENKFESPRKRFESTGKKFGAPNKQFEPREKKFESSDRKFGSEENKFESPKKRFESGRKKFDSRRKKFGSPDKKFTAGKKLESPSLELRDQEETSGMVLNKFLSNAGIASRRLCAEFIQQGMVTVNGKPVTTPGYRVQKNDEISYKGTKITSGKKVYILLNKPKDFITTTSDEQGRHTVMELIKNATTERVFPVGRLDRNTTGLLLFTNDGELAQKLTHPSKQVKKVYDVTLDREVAPEDMERIAAGIELDDGLAAVDEIAYSQPPDRKVIGIELHIGKNRIVRRIFERLGYDVRKLDRVLYAGLTKKDLPRGKWRHLSEKEIRQLKFLS